jgi:hypothetical protein
VISYRSKYWFRFLVLGLLLSTSVSAQEILQTLGGTVSINLDYGTSSTLLQGNKLKVQINYDEAILIATLTPSTLVNPSEQGIKINANFPFDEIILTGKFGVDYIETSNHEPLQFEFTGALTQNGREVPVHGMAELQHIGGGGDFSCLLGFNFTVSSSLIPSEFDVPDDLKEIKVQVLQTILNRKK